MKEQRLIYIELPDFSKKAKDLAQIAQDTVKDGTEIAKEVAKDCSYCSN